MDITLSHLGWALYAVALAAAPFHIYNIKFNQEDIQNRVLRVLVAAVLFPLMGLALWGVGYIFVLAGKLMATPAIYIFSLLR